MKRLLSTLCLFLMLFAAQAQDTIYTVNNFGANNGIRQIIDVNPTTGAIGPVSAPYGLNGPNPLTSSGMALAGDYLYYIIEVTNNLGFFSISSIRAYETPTSGPLPPSVSSAPVFSNVDINGPGNDNQVFFRRMAMAPDGYVYIAATEEASGVVYLGRFLPNGSGGRTGEYEPLGTITLDGVNPAGNFRNGDIAFDAAGNIYALVNQDQAGGRAVVCYAAAATISTTAGGTTEMQEVFEVADNNGDPFMGLVVGFAMASNGNFYTAVQNNGGTDGGIYLTRRDGSDNVIMERISTIDGDNVGDLATSYFPTQIVLPVTYGDIKAKIQDNALVLNWSTLAETNNARFDIEASADGVHFEKIGSVDSKAANGNSDRVLYYSFTRSVDGQMALLGISLLSLASILLFLTRKNRMLLSAALVIGLGLSIGSCSKEGGQVDVGDRSKLYVRIIQVDKDTKSSVSEVVTAYKVD